MESEPESVRAEGRAPEASERLHWRARALARARRFPGWAKTVPRRVRPHLWPLTKRALPWMFFMALPFLMFAWALPFVTKRGFGNDYVVYPISAQLDMMWSMRRGTFPVYMPGFAGGHSTASMTLGQLYHPITWLSSWMPGYWKGDALEWNTVFRFLFLGFAHGLAFRLCRRLSLGKLVSFIATFAIFYNLRMLDSLRYGASLEGFTGMTLVASSAGLVYLSPGKKRLIALLAFSTYSVVVSGHPQWAYLGMLAGTIFAALFPWVARALSPSLPGNSIRGLARYVRDLAIGMTSGVAVAMVYVLPFAFEYFKTNRTRAENPYEWTLLYSDTLRGELANFFFPLHADVHGAFGGSAMFVLAALFPLAFLARIKIPKILWVVWLLLAVTFSFSAGKYFLDGVIHRFMVEHLPAFGSFRAPGRIVLWIPILSLPIWAWLFREDNHKALVFVIAGAIVLMLGRWFWDSRGLPKPELWTPHKIYIGPRMQPDIDTRVLVPIAGALVLFLVAALYPRTFRFVAPLGLAAVMFSSYKCLEWGTWTQVKQPTWTGKQIAQWRKQSPNSHADPGEGMELRTITEFRKQKVNTNRSLGTIVHKVEKSPGEPQIYKLLRKNDETKIYLDRDPTPLSPETDGDTDTVRLVYNTSNRFVFDVHVAREAYFVFGQPHLQGFVISIDGVEQPIELSNVMFPTVTIPKGTHVVEVRFVSRPFLAGACIAFGTIAAWIVFATRRRLTTRTRQVGLAVGLIACAVGGGFLLHHMLYRGPSFRTSVYWALPLPSDAAAPAAPATPPAE